MGPGPPHTPQLSEASQELLDKIDPPEEHPSHALIASQIPEHETEPNWPRAQKTVASHHDRQLHHCTRRSDIEPCCEPPPQLHCHAAAGAHNSGKGLVEEASPEVGTLAKEKGFEVSCLQPASQNRAEVSSPAPPHTPNPPPHLGVLLSLLFAFVPSFSCGLPFLSNLSHVLLKTDLLLDLGFDMIQKAWADHQRCSMPDKTTEGLLLFDGQSAPHALALCLPRSFRMRILNGLQTPEHHFDKNQIETINLVNLQGVSQSH